MLAARLAAALDAGMIALPDAGRIAVIGPVEDADLGLLPKERVAVVTRHHPVHERFSRQGYDATTALDGPFSLSILTMPRAKAEARQMLARAMAATDGPVIVDGSKTDGVDSLWREARRIGDVSEALSKAHGKLFVVRGGDFSAWDAAEGGVPAGAFSADGPDPGSVALVAALPPRLPGAVVDLGAGWGYLSEAILSRDGVERLDLVEADHLALEAARARIADDRAAFHWADARTWRPARAADHVVTNPPFHQGRKAEPGLGRAFIHAASGMLAPSGTLWLVANRHLPYEAVLNETFRDIVELDGPPAFKLIRARKPKRPFGRG